MSNIAKAFAGGKAFIPFITCGDPDLDTTEQAARAMARAGADLIELGIPFSSTSAVVRMKSFRSTGMRTAFTRSESRSREPPKSRSSVTTDRAGAPAASRSLAAWRTSRPEKRRPSAGEISLKSGMTGTYPARRRSSRRAVNRLMRSPPRRRGSGPPAPTAFPPPGRSR